MITMNAKNKRELTLWSVSIILAVSAVVVFFTNATTYMPVNDNIKTFEFLIMILGLMYGAILTGYDIGKKHAKKEECTCQK